MLKEEKKIWKIYYLKCKTTNKFYIGVTSLSLRDRWAHGLGYRNQPVIYSAIQQYGWKDFEHGVIDIAHTYKESRKKEKDSIKKYNSLFPNGYNIVKGESGEIRSLWKETIIKIDESGKIIESYKNSLELKNKYNTNEIRTIRELLFSTQEDYRPRYYKQGYWGFSNIYEEMLSNIEVTILFHKGGQHLGKSKKLCKIDKNGNILQIFSSGREAVRQTENAKRTSMITAIKSNKEYLGFYWKYL